MWNRQTANLAQGAALIVVFLIASRDVDRTMRQQPVTPQQNQVLFDWAERRK